jgi:hypothetical protein
MDKNSLFINKLTSAPKPDIPLYNIISSGCNMDGEDGDGVVTSKSQYLSYAKNYYFNGTCNDNSDFSYFHNEILDVEKYPEVYRLLRELLKN